MYLNCKSAHSCNNIQRSSQDTAVCQRRIKFPDCSSSFHSGNARDDGHDSNDSEIQNVSKAGEAVFVSIEGVNVAAMQNVFYLVAGCVVIAGIIGRHNEKLSSMCSSESVVFRGEIEQEIPL
jgi:hypothetical protein